MNAVFSRENSGNIDIAIWHFWQAIRRTIGGLIMSLDKAIEHKKEHRKQYRGAKAVDKSCRNHGGCPHCEARRKHKYLRQMPAEEVEHEK